MGLGFRSARREEEKRRKGEGRRLPLV
ncbi:hypothetical protein LINPERPRIM_LOCUS17744 [Linum perenne]